MTDIVERLRTQGVMDENCCPQCGAADTDQIDWLMCEAADEIERLNKAIKWEQNWLSRIGTHSEGCWQWGPTHYQCALRHIEEMSNAS